MGQKECRAIEVKQCCRETDLATLLFGEGRAEATTLTLDFTSCLQYCILTEHREQQGK